MNDLLLVILLGVAAAAVVFGVIYLVAAGVLKLIHMRQDRANHGPRVDELPGEVEQPIVQPARALRVRKESAPRAAEAVKPEAIPAAVRVEKPARRRQEPTVAPEIPEASSAVVEPVSTSQTGVQAFPRATRPEVVPEAPIMLDETDPEQQRQVPETTATAEHAAASDTRHTETVDTPDDVEFEDDEPIVEVDETHYPSGDEVPDAQEIPQIPELQIADEPEVPAEPAVEPEALPEQPYAGLKVDPFAALRAGMNRR